MFSKGKVDKAKRKSRDANEDRPRPTLSQLGLMEVPDVSNMSIGAADNDDEDDEDLEAELLALTGGKPSQGKKKARKVGPSSENLDKMVAACMDDNYEGDSDVEEPDLMAELSALVQEEDDDESSTPPSDPISDTSPSTPVSAPARPAPVILRPSPLMAGPSVLALLRERIQMYEEAEANALAGGEAARAKRFSRGLKTLKQMVREVSSGRAINEEDIPPQVLTSSSRSNSTRDLSGAQGDPDPAPRPATSIPQTIAFGQSGGDKSSAAGEVNSSPSPALTTLKRRQHDYKMAALSAKHRGDKESAIRLMRVAKQIDPLIQAANEGNTVDLDSLPPPPSETEAPTGKDSREPEEGGGGAPPGPPPVGAPSSQGPPPLPSSTLEALEQRLAKYAEQRDKAVSEGNARKERMNTRILKQYQDAIRAHKLGRFVEFSELPSPPGFAPIPTGGAGPVPPGEAPVPGGAAPPPVPTGGTGATAPVEGPRQAVPAGPARAAPQKPALQPAKTNVRNAPQSRVERQFSVLKRRQDLFKDAALDAKRRGELEQAKEYLRNYKGCQQLITATASGLPVDMNTVPIPPQEKVETEGVSLDFEVVEKEDCIVAPPATAADVSLAFTKLEEDLIAQIKMCATTRQHLKNLGDVASANRFEQLILHSKKDLDAVRVAFKRGDKPPRFHYENRTFTIIQCNTDLNDSDCEVTIVRGINLNVSNPSEVDTCVRLEFPFPSDAPPQERTGVVKDTNNPEFNHKVVFSIDRKARALARVFKRHSIKCQVICKGGWFHRDSVIGSAKIPLVSLETKVSLHEAFDLIDDRKKMVGGKLEVKVRLRNPLLTKQLEEVNEKWVVIDGF